MKVDLREIWRERIFMALGSASMCWGPKPGNQIFDSTTAKEIGDGLMEELEKVLRIVEAARDALDVADRLAKYIEDEEDYRELRTVLKALEKELDGEK